MRVRSMLATAAVAATALVVAAAPAFAADSSTAAVQTNAQAPVIPTLVAVRTAHHPGFDRITFEFSGPRPGHRIGYVAQLVEDASGKPVQLAGGAAINVIFQGANAHDDQGQPTVSPRRFAAGPPPAGPRGPVRGRCRSPARRPPGWCWRASVCWPSGCWCSPWRARRARPDHRGAHAATVVLPGHRTGPGAAHCSVRLAGRLESH